MKKHTTILILLMLAATALAQRTEQREQKSLLILPSRDGRRQSQQAEKIQELRQFLEEQGLMMRQNVKYNNPNKGISWVLQKDVRYPIPHADENTSEAEALLLKQHYDSIGRAYQAKLELAVDSARKVFLSLASHSVSSDFYEYHKNGVDTVRYTLCLQAYPTKNQANSNPTSAFYNELLRFTYTQNLNSENPSFRLRCYLTYKNYLPPPDSIVSTYFDIEEYEAVISNVVQPLLEKKQVMKYPLYWKMDADYKADKDEYEYWQYSEESRNRLIIGNHWFFPKKFESEAIAALLRLDSLTEDYVDKHPKHELTYEELTIGEPWALDFYHQYDGIEHTLLDGSSKNHEIEFIVIRKETDGIHLLSLITDNGDLWFPRGWNKLERWENGVGTPLPTPTPPPSPTFLYSTHSNVTVQEVRQTKEATTLVMNYQGSPYGLLSISSSTRLVDEQGQPVPITGVDEFALDSTIILPQNGKMDFTLHFKPLPKGTRIFDLIEGQRSNEFRIYGITDGTQRIKIPVRTEAIDPKEVTKASLSPDSVCIRGHIANYDRQTMPRFICSDYHSDRLDFTDHSIYPICCRIDSSGNFSLSFLADHAVWNFLDLVETNRRLPFLVHPGDTLQIDIENYGQWNEQVRYRSQHGHNVGSGLMHLSRDLHEYYYTGMPKVKDPETYLKETEQFYKGKSRFYDYIVWKYRLTPWEAHLLTGNLSMDKVLKRLGYLSEQYSEYFTSWSTLPEEQRPDHSELFFKPKETAFLREVNWNDPSLAFQSGWLAVSVNYFMNSPLQKFVFDTMTDMNSEAFREKLLEEFPNMAPNLVEEFIRQEMPRKKLPVALHREETYTPTNPAVQRFIASLLPDCKSELLQLMFIDRKNALNLNKWYNDYHNIIEDFSKTPQLSFVIVMEKDTETEKVEQGLRYRFPNTRIRFVPTETFLDLCEGFRIFSFPEDITINNKGEILKSPFNSYDESTFRQSLKRLQKAFSGKK